MLLWLDRFFFIIYNESVHEKILQKIETLFFTIGLWKNTNLIKTEMDMYETALCHHAHIFSYQIRAFKLRLLFKIRDNWPIKLAVGVNNTRTSGLVVLVLSPSKYNSPVVLYDNPALFHAAPSLFFKYWYIFLNSVNIGIKKCS